MFIMYFNYRNTCDMILLNCYCSTNISNLSYEVAGKQTLAAGLRMLVEVMCEQKHLTVRLP